MIELNILNVLNWRRVRDACERDERPMLLDPDPMAILITELPELPIKWIDHAVYEVVGVDRLNKGTTLQKLEPGYYYSQAPGQPYATHVTLLRWALRGEDNDHCFETCKACRLCCGCNCGGDRNQG